MWLSPFDLFMCFFIFFAGKTFLKEIFIGIAVGEGLAPPACIKSTQYKRRAHIRPRHPKRNEVESNAERDTTCRDLGRIILYPLVDSVLRTPLRGSTTGFALRSE